MREALEITSFRLLPAEERERRTIEGEASAAARLGLSVADLRQILAGPPRSPQPARRTERCPACGRQLTHSMERPGHPHSRE